MRLWTGSMTALALAGLAGGCNRAPDNGATQTAATNTLGNAALPALPQALPMQAGPATGLGVAPPASALATSGPLRVASLPSPGDAYAYLDRAAGQSDAYGDAPPDYAFDYDGVSPWAWQAGDGSTEYAEPVDGGYRSYYYQPGEDDPYLVRDGDYSYAYAGAALVAIYLGGRLLPRAQWGERERYAAGYRSRAENLYRASRDDRRGVVAADWAARRQQIAQQRDAWSAERAQQAEWAAYHQQHAVQEQDHWAQDRQQRAVVTQRFDAWQQQGYRGQAPYARSTPERAPENRQPENRPQAVISPIPDHRGGQAPSAANSRPAPPSFDARRPPQPAERPTQPPAPDRRALSPEPGRAPMLGSDAQRMRQHDVRPLEAPLHEPQRAGVRVTPPSEPSHVEVHRGRGPTESAPAMPHVSYGERPAPIDREHIESRPAPERAPPHVEAPHMIPEHAPPHIEAPHPAPHVEAPHEAPHPAPPHASEPHGGDHHH